MPSRMNGQRTNQSVAPTSFMISISVRRAYTAVRIVFMMITTLITSSIRAMAAPTPSMMLMIVCSLLMTSLL